MSLTCFPYEVVEKNACFWGTYWGAAYGYSLPWLSTKAGRL
jgi:hypothetical protein